MRFFRWVYAIPVAAFATGLFVGFVGCGKRPPLLESDEPVLSVEYVEETRTRGIFRVRASERVSQRVIVLVEETVFDEGERRQRDVQSYNRHVAVIERGANRGNDMVVHRVRNFKTKVALIDFTDFVDDPELFERYLQTVEVQVDTTPIFFFD